MNHAEIQIRQQACGLWGAYDAPEAGQAKTWVLEGQNSRGWYGAIALRRLVTSRKGRFTWRTPSENPYILQDDVRRTIESRYADIAFAMSNT